MGPGEGSLEDFLIRIGDPVIVRGPVDELVILSIGIDRIAEVALIVVEPFLDAGTDGVEIHTEGFDPASVDILLGENALFELGENAFLVGDVVRQADRFIPGVVVGIRDRHVVLDGRTVFRRDEDDTPGGTASVDGCGGRIFQHGNALDVVRVHEREVRNLDAIEEDKRSVHPVDRTHTTDLHCRGSVQVIGIVGDGQARDDALKALGNVRNRFASKSFVDIDGGDGAGEVDFLLGTETDHDDLVEEFCIVREDDLQVLKSRQGLGLVADAGDLEGSARIRLDRETAAGIGHGTLGRSLDHDTGSGNRLTLGINNDTARGDLLLHCNFRRGSSCFKRVGTADETGC